MLTVYIELLIKLPHSKTGARDYTITENCTHCTKMKRSAGLVGAQQLMFSLDPHTVSSDKPDSSIS